jgi:iron complex outermembrane recepter protein
MVALALSTASAWAQQAPQRVEIVGSRLPRLSAETALPVQIIRREEIERSGVANAEQLLERVSSNFGSHRETLGLGDGDTPGFSGASLRGFGAAETLVLLNGRRLANYAFTGIGGPGVDLHAIPLAAIERVEVLKDGASALYGSDAIAGVINFVTRQDYAGAQATLNYTGTEAGGGERERATLAAGHGDLVRDGYNIFGAIDLQRAATLRAIDRAYASTAYRPDLGLDGTSPLSWPANIRQFVNGGLVLRSPASPACTAMTVRKGDACWFDYAKTLELLPKSEQQNALGRGTLRLTPQTDAYAEVSAAHSRMRFAASPSPAGASVSQSGVRFVLPETSPYYPSGLGLAGGLVLAYRTAPLGPRTSEVDARNTRLLVGLRSSVDGWDFDGALTVSDSQARERYVSGFVDAGLLGRAIGSGLVNPFGASGAEGDALLAAAELRGLSRTSRGRSQAADWRATRVLTQLPGGPLGLAAGIDVRHEDLRDEQGAVVSDVVGGGVSSAKQGERSARAVFIEAVAPLRPGFDMQIAARWDHYSDFGSAVSPKLALRLQPAAQWLLRASVGRGFRAPSLPELHTAQQSAFFELVNAGVSDPVRCPVTGLPSDCQPEVTVVSGGNPALKPQRSTQTSAGLLLEPAKGWQASVDVWSVRVLDIIGALNFDDVIQDIARYDGRNVVRGPVDPGFPNLPGPIVRIETLNQNLGDWRVSGADLSVSLQPTATPMGRVSMRLDGTYVRRARQNIVKGHEIDLVGRLAPRWLHTLTMTLERQPWSASLSQRYRRGYDDATLLPDGSVHRVGSYLIWEGQVAFSAGRDWVVTLGVHNLLDTAPPLSNQRSHFQLGYDPLYADPLGRTWYVGLRAEWP